MEISEELKRKLNNLKSFFIDKKVIVAFSGGVDSSLLAFLSSRYAEKTLLITERSILYPDEEIDESTEFAKLYNIPQEIIEANPLSNEDFKANPQNRCFICKKQLYSEIIKIKEKREYDVIVDGTNLDDLTDYRPGYGALQELKINTPYVEFDISKKDIRDLSQYFNLTVQSKPSMACFSSRIPYGQIIDEEKLHRIRLGEKFLKQTFNLNQLRVRHHENKLARIEFLPQDLHILLKEENLELIKKKFKELGFYYITIDIEGFRSGSMNLPILNNL